MAAKKLTKEQQEQRETLAHDEANARARKQQEENRKRVFEIDREITGCKERIREAEESIRNAWSLDLSVVQKLKKDGEKTAQESRARIRALLKSRESLVRSS